jgi:hypothetical protein
MWKLSKSWKRRKTPQQLRRRKKKPECFKAKLLATLWYSSK